MSKLWFGVAVIGGSIGMLSAYLYNVMSGVHGKAYVVLTKKTKYIYVEPSLFYTTVTSVTEPNESDPHKSTYLTTKDQNGNITCSDVLTERHMKPVLILNECRAEIEALTILKLKTTDKERETTNTTNDLE